ncbi:hypothetical protein Tco_1154158 [Tanacetum coccineum]
MLHGDYSQYGIVLPELYIVPLIPTFIASDDPLIVSSSRIPTIPCQMADFLAVHALCSAWAIVVKLALVSQWKSSSILLPFTSPSDVSLGHILPLGKLLLSFVVVIQFSLTLGLTFSKSADLLIHQFICKLNCILHCLRLRRHYTPMYHVGKTTNILFNLIRLFGKHPPAHQSQLLKALCNIMKGASSKLNLVLDCTVTDIEDCSLMSGAYRSSKTTSRTLASIAIEVIVSLNFLLSQSISHASGYQCPDRSISHWGGGSSSGGGGSDSSYLNPLFEDDEEIISIKVSKQISPKVNSEPSIESLPKDDFDDDDDLFEIDSNNDEWKRILYGEDFERMNVDSDKVKDFDKSSSNVFKSLSDELEPGGSSHVEGNDLDFHVGDVLFSTINEDKIFNQEYF